MKICRMWCSSSALLVQLASKPTDLSALDVLWMRPWGQIRSSVTFIRTLSMDGHVQTTFPCLDMVTWLIYLCSSSFPHCHLLSFFWFLFESDVTEVSQSNAAPTQLQSHSQRPSPLITPVWRELTGFWQRPALGDRRWGRRAVIEGKESNRPLGSSVISYRGHFTDTGPKEST